jgi:uncharacterized protein (TIGR00297 family)
MQIVIGITLATIISIAAWRAGSLSTSGAVAAAATGGLIFGFGGLPWAILLLTFFVSSSLLSRTFKQQKTVISEKFFKGSQRDWGQVLANGGLGTILVLISALFSSSIAHGYLYIIFAGAMAAVNADTWATELGVLNPRLPRLVTNGRPVEPGTSGGISVYGSLAALAGAGLIGLTASQFSMYDQPWLLGLGVALGGVIGSFFDSLLGASIQAIYYCSQCKKETERHPYHTCSTQTVQIRGWHWLNNDWVNFFASAVGGGTAVGLTQLLF